MTYNIDNNMVLEILPRESDSIIKSLSLGNMVVVRLKNEFIYILDSNDRYLLFYHIPGSPDGGKRQFEKNDKYTAIIRKFADLADSLFKVEFDRSCNLYNIMASVEDAILSTFPGNDLDNDEDIEFIIPNQTRQHKNKGGQYNAQNIS